jgi:hypothetical protein
MNQERRRERLGTLGIRTNSTNCAIKLKKKKRNAGTHKNLDQTEELLIWPNILS